MDDQQIKGGHELLDPANILQNILQIPDGATVADLGVGSMAFFTLQSAKLVGNKGVVYACDIMKDVLNSMESKAKMAGLNNIKSVWTNLEVYGATKIPVPVDYAVLVNTLFQTTKRQEVLREANRLLKPGGKLLIIEWRASSGPIGPDAKRRLAENEAESLATAAGFKKISNFIAGPSHYGLIFEK